MKYALLLSLLGLGQFSAASLRTDVSGKSVTCGSLTLKFDADASKVTVGKRKYQPEWMTGMNSAEIAGKTFEIQNGDLGWGEEDCSL